MSNTFNISTTSAIVIAAAGVPVAKHGNRSVSSSSGSADVLEALGVKVDLGPEKRLRNVSSHQTSASSFAPSSTRDDSPLARAGRSAPTIFNILGP